MGESIILKPYKRNVAIWKNVPDSERKDDERSILRVEIGQMVTVDDQTKEVIREKPIQEDVYLDILQGLFSGQSYTAVATLGYEPQMIITYEGRLVIHNDYIPNYVRQVKKIFGKVKYSAGVKAMLNYVANVNSGEKYTAYLKKLQEWINEKCKANYPPEFVALALKEYICDDCRDVTEEEMEYGYLTYEELLKEAGNVLINREAEKQEKETDKGAALKEKYILNELLYRFVQGNLVEKR